MMKKDENEGALDLKKNSWETLAPRIHSRLPNNSTRNVNAGRVGSSDSGTT